MLLIPRLNLVHVVQGTRLRKLDVTGLPFGLYDVLSCDLSTEVGLDLLRVGTVLDVAPCLRLGHHLHVVARRHRHTHIGLLIGCLLLGNLVAAAI